MAFGWRPLILLSMCLAMLLQLSGCANEPPVQAGFERVTILGHTFDLEMALDEDTRVLGLSGRESVDPDGGMLFVFPPTQVGEKSFLMRDCLVPIDIIFLNRQGRVTAMHAMPIEEPRGAGEGTFGETGGSPANIRYQMRLPRYPSRGPAQFAIELAGGTIADRLSGLSVGDKIELDVERLGGLAK